VWSLRTPGSARVERWLEGLAGAAFTYAPVGVTASDGLAPASYFRDHTRVELGWGEDAWAAAKAALASWATHDLGWLVIVPARPVQREGGAFASVLRVGGLVWWAPCRIVYTVDEPDRRGFAIGTIGPHPEAGEERFMVSRDPGTGAVHYDLLAVSRPRHWAPRLCLPWTRRLQRRFAADSSAAMRRAVTARRDV